jgi:hypothetical protein
MGFFTLETAQAQLSPAAISDPGSGTSSSVEHVSADELRLRLPFDDRIARPGAW